MTAAHVGVVLVATGQTLPTVDDSISVGTFFVQQFGTGAPSIVWQLVANEVSGSRAWELVSGTSSLVQAFALLSFNPSAGSVVTVTGKVSNAAGVAQATRIVSVRVRAAGGTLTTVTASVGTLQFRGDDAGVWVWVDVVTNNLGEFSLVFTWDSARAATWAVTCEGAHGTSSQAFPA